MFRRWKNYFQWTTKTPETRKRSFQLEEKKFKSSKEIAHQLNSLPRNNTSDPFTSLSTSGYHLHELQKIHTQIDESISIVQQQLESLERVMSNIQNQIDEFYLADAEATLIEPYEKDNLLLKSKYHHVISEKKELEKLKEKMNSLF